MATKYRTGDPQVDRILDEAPWLGHALLQVKTIQIQRLLGFWVMIQTFGGRDNLRALYPKASLNRQLREFREVFGMEVEDFRAEFRGEG